MIGPGLALVSAATEGVPLFERCPPAHTVFIGASRVAVGDRTLAGPTIAIAAGTPHTPEAFEGPVACVAYLDPRMYEFADAERLAELWRGFKPGVDSLRQAAAAVLPLAPRRIDPRVARALEIIEHEGVSVAEAAARVQLSTSRLTHLTTDILGASPRVWGAWFKLLRAIRHVSTGASLTEAAHQAGFADSSHLTRTCKRLTGVRPARMIPQAIYELPYLAAAAPDER